MKYLENATLEAFISALSVESGDCKLDTRLESYSCKMVQNDKRQWKRALAPGTSPRDLQPLSPAVGSDCPWPFPNGYPESAPNSTQLLDVYSGRVRHRSERSLSGSDGDVDEGPVFCDSISRKTLFDLTAVLNTSFSDYDFSGTKSDSFSLVASVELVAASVNAKLLAVVPTYNQLRAPLWRAIDDEIKIAECKIYSYNPDYSSDPFCDDGCVWSFNYFFYNKCKKRILFFSCRALRDQWSNQSSDQMWSFEEDDECDQ
jgi:hypothetical protein